MNILDSAATRSQAQLLACLCSTNAATDSVKTDEDGCVPIKLYL